MEAPQRFLDIYDKSTVPNQVEYAFSSVIDEGISNVTAALKAKNMWDNTLMTVSADNGGPAFSDQHAASNYPLRGGKYTYFEGGIRVNAFVTGGLLPAKMRGKNISSAVHICDWYATFSGLAGIDPADDADGVPPIDSIDQWPVLSGAAAQPLRTEIFIGGGVLIQDNYKLIKTGAGNAQWSGPLYPKVKATGPANLNCSKKVPCLFDVVADPWEYTDVAADHADIVANMSARLDVLMDGTFEGKGDADVKQADVCAATQKNGMYLTPADWKPPRAA